MAIKRKQERKVGIIIKKINCFLLCVVLCVCIFPNIDGIAKYSANESTPEIYETFAEAYFKHLKNNYGENVYGTCGYVAVGMLLSYYDTFHDNNIIPGDFIKKCKNLNDNNMIRRADSPGVNQENIYHLYGEDLNETQYHEKVVEYANNNYFHSYLVMLGYEMGIFPKERPEEEVFGGIYKEEIVELMHWYLQNETECIIEGEGEEGRIFPAFEDSDYTITAKYKDENGETSNSIINYTISMVQQGIPVLLCVRNPIDEKSHALIAYDYDSAEGILCHFGWDDTKIGITPESEGYTVYKAAITLEWNTPHVCSDNYVVKIESTGGDISFEKTYCYEHKDIITYDHVCSYGEWVTTDAKHTKTCHCTEKIEGAHTYDSNNTCTVCEHHTHDYHYSYVSRTQCKGVCEYCNYQIITTHNINLLTKVCRQCFARFSNDGVEVPINNLPPDIVCTKNHQHNSSCVIVARE